MKKSAIWLAILAVAAACKSSSSEPTSPSSGASTACRTYPTSTDIASTSSILGTTNSSASATFDRSTSKLTTTVLFVNGTLCSTSIASYPSIADFVDEVSVIPGLTLVATNVTTTLGLCGAGTQTTNYSYDTQKRLMRTTTQGETTTYTAWDSSGRPTRGSTSSGTSITNVYDNAARTTTQTQIASNGSQTVSTQTFDSKGNQTKVVVVEAAGTSTTTYSVTATGVVCK